MRRRFARSPVLSVFVAAAVIAACSPTQGDSDAAAQVGTDAGTPGQSAATVTCDPQNGGITLPQGFCATVFADDVGAARHMAIAPNGDVFVALRGNNGGIVALRDTTADGHADVQRRWSVDAPGTGMALDGETLYFGSDTGVLRFHLPTGSLEPSGGPDTIVSGLPARPGHSAKSIALSDGTMFVNIGSPSNSCQKEDRGNGSPGKDPCAELQTRAGIWRFDPSRTGQTESDGTRFATGIRNAVAITVHGGELYAMQHGRDQLFQNWGKYYTAQQGAELPAEEFLHVTNGDDFGWPYCYYDQNQGKLILAPEYGGTGSEVGRCADRKGPLMAFPGHWAPDGITFYDGDQFPQKYRGGVFIGFHGSWNRAPQPQAGYKVVFVPMANGQPSGEYEVFADGFAGGNLSPNDAAHRPTGLSVGPDGSLYVSDDQGGRIWRIVWQGGGS